VGDSHPFELDVFTGCPSTTCADILKGWRTGRGA
jgi:hypothetical protein